MSSSISISRRVQLIDTDAAGTWHHSVIIRWAEEAEAELHRKLGTFGEVFGSTPRVRIEFEYAGYLRFDDLADITLTVTELGETSITYGVEVSADSKTVVTGQVVAVLVDRETGTKRSWPEHVRRVLTTTNR